MVRFGLLGVVLVACATSQVVAPTVDGPTVTPHMSTWVARPTAKERAVERARDAFVSRGAPRAWVEGRVEVSDDEGRTRLTFLPGVESGAPIYLEASVGETELETWRAGSTWAVAPGVRLRGIDAEPEAHVGRADFRLELTKPSARLRVRSARLETSPECGRAVERLRSVSYVADDGEMSAGQCSTLTGDGGHDVTVSFSSVARPRVGCDRFVVRVVFEIDGHVLVATAGGAWSPSEAR